MLSFLEPLLHIEATPSCILDVQIGIQLPDARRQLCRQPCEKLRSDGSPIFHHHMGTVQPTSLQPLIVLAAHRAYQSTLPQRHDVTQFRLVPIAQQLLLQPLGTLARPGMQAVLFWRLRHLDKPLCQFSVIVSFKTYT